MPEAISVREALRLLWEADCYLRIGNHDWVVGRAMEDEALAKAELATPSLDDPPEFAVWLSALRNRDLSVDEREEIYWGLHDYFGGGGPGSHDGWRAGASQRWTPIPKRGTSSDS